MDEHASFETRAVLAPRRARRSRLALLLPAVALVAVAWAGVSGPPSPPVTAEVPSLAAIAAPSLTVEPSIPAEAPYPTQVLGLDVHRLDAVHAQGLGPDEVIAISGWYVAIAMTDCPPLVALFRQSAPPEFRGYVDQLAYCTRSGVLYASSPAVQDSWSGSAGLGAVAVTLVAGVIVPPELETIGTDATEVVVLGRFVRFRNGCDYFDACPQELLVDHVAWTPGV